MDRWIRRTDENKKSVLPETKHVRMRIDELRSVSPLRCAAGDRSARIETNDCESEGCGNQNKIHRHSAGQRRPERRFANYSHTTPAAHSECGKMPKRNHLANRNPLTGKRCSFVVLGKRRVVDRLELDRYVDFRNAQARNQNNAND